ncbi:peroxisomal multifunctional enzyme type 2 [Acinetobacter wuhouensis]|uniref:SDR family NAD(P)-dependent oxidoreductase n=1 Tax=Acinetobacter wuhouensis TaxID=1879050 RepID=A0A4Q7AEF4_9GAMM|nr:peroxisomal multifunctional enzyme type 2 [Acinetobacter wuhouensis]RZG44555.1 SDR family NAD(P)-dependent oxidoreductase [Acinetobacter wuhouensis]RZG73974.1 SDR family NAD(P)-dependent oxidoreductase [Acinetobacter wuhouensis]
MSELRFDGRVAIVTGAGGGLGRQHALTLAARGCKVVVNDLGGGAHGSGQSSSAADQVVEEIRAAGGEAVANYDSVENGEAIVQTALEHFGTVDIVINNAGILRDVSFAKMTEQDWDLIMRVHLNGSKSVSHAAWPIMREKGYGRIIMTTSAAGIYGNFGQANYCAAKLGILGLANCLAEEGRSKNIFVNTIAPLAASRLTETVMPPDLLALLKPEAVSPLVAWLAHEDCKENKGLFEVGAGFVAKLRWERTEGYIFPNKRPFNVDDVARHWDKITDFTESTHPTSTTESFTPILEGINHPNLGGNEFIDLDVASKAKLEIESSYDERDLSLYALGIGAAQNPLDSSELAYVYELGSEFQAFPTYGVMPQMNAMLQMAKQGVSLPGMNYGFDRVLHGEQYTEIKRPLPPHAKLQHTFTLKSAYDKDPNAVVTFAISSKDENGEELIYNEMTAFVRGAGGWGGDRGDSTEINVAPEREPDAVIEEKTDVNQTLLYRLSGDWNPLHADPAFAKAFGFDRPILHGLCTFGFSGRHVIKAFSNNDGRYFKSIKVRFAKSVYPGDTLVTKMWKESDTKIIFETWVKERNEVVIKNAAIELYTEIPKAKAKAKTEQASVQAVQTSNEPDRLIAKDVFKVIAEHVAQHPELVDKTKTSFLFKLKNPDSMWTLDLKNGVGSCTQGEIANADVTLEMDEEHLETVVTSSLADVQKLFFGGQLKIGGNVMASNKLIVLQEIDSKLFAEAKNQRIANASSAGSSDSTTNSASTVNTEITLADVFTAVNQYITNTAGIVDKTKTSFQFKLKNPESTWFIDLKNGAGSAGAGEVANPDVSLEMDEEHVPTVFNGSLADVQKLFFGGQLKIGGNVMASNKLIVLQDMDKKLIDQARDARVASGDTTQAAAAPTSTAKEAKAPEIFTALQNRLKGESNANHTYQFNITEPNESWTVNLANGSVQQGSDANADVTLTLSDHHLAELVSSQREIRDLYQHGDVVVDGDIRLVHQMQFLQNLA